MRNAAAAAAVCAADTTAAANATKARASGAGEAPVRGATVGKIAPSAGRSKRYLIISKRMDRVFRVAELSCSGNIIFEQLFQVPSGFAAVLEQLVGAHRSGKVAS